MNSLAFLSRQLDARRQPAPAPHGFRRAPTWASFAPFRQPSPRRSSSSPALLAAGHPPPSAPSRFDSVLRLLLLFCTRISHLWAALIARLSALYRFPAKVFPPPHASPSPPSSRRFTIDPSSQTPPSPADAPDDSSRTATPPSRKPGIQQPKTLVLDLDETLIHSTSKPIPAGGTGLFRLGSFGRRNAAAGHMVEVVLQGKSTLYHVYKRPFVDFFLRTVRRSIFTEAPYLTRPLRRSPDGTRWSYSPPPCKNMQTPSLIGWTPVVASWLNVSSETLVFLLVPDGHTHIRSSRALNYQTEHTRRTYLSSIRIYPVFA